MKPGGVLTAVASVLCWTTVLAATQDDRFPFTVEDASPHEAPEHRLADVEIGVRDAKGDCDRWLVDLLVPIEDRLVRVSARDLPQSGSKEPSAANRCWSCAAKVGKAIRSMVHSSGRQRTASGLTIAPAAPCGCLPALTRSHPPRSPSS